MDMGPSGLDLLAHWISTDQERRSSVDGGDRASASSVLPQSPRMSQSFGMSRMLSYNPRRSEEVPLPFSRSVPFSRTWSLERSSSNHADTQMQLEDMEAMVQGYTLMSSQSTPPMPVPKVHTKGNNYNPPPSPVVGRSVAASMGDIEVYWKSMYLE